jgi:hypothetical protein
MRDEMNDRPVLSRADLALLKSAHAPSDAQIAASRRAIAARIAAIAAGGAVTAAASSANATSAASAASATGATAAVKSAALLGAAKWISAGVLVSAVAGGAVVATQRAREDKPPAVSSSRAPAVAQAPVAVPAAAPSEPAAAVTPTEAEPVAKASPGPRPIARRQGTAASRPLEGETLAGELALLRNAREALERGDARAALRELDAHAARFASPVLRQEALAARALALCAADRASDARRVAAQLARIAPRSPHLIGLADSCALEDGE